MSESSAGARKGGGWGGLEDWTYRVGVELAEAHFAGFKGFVWGISVPSLAVCCGM